MFYLLCLMLVSCRTELRVVHTDADTPDSHLFPEARCCGRDNSWYSLVPPTKRWHSSLRNVTTAYATAFEIRHLQIVSFDVTRYKASLNKRNKYFYLFSSFCFQFHHRLIFPVCTALVRSVSSSFPRLLLLLYVTSYFCERLDVRW